MQADRPHHAVSPTQRKLIAGMILLLAVCAGGLAGYLAWHAFRSGPIAGCGASSTVACDEVLGTKWSRWFGIPVALLALINYLGVGAAAIMLWSKSPSWHHRGLLLLITTAGLATAAAFWFTGLQLFTIFKLCPFCLATHACGLLIGVLCAVLLLLYLREESAQLSRSLPVAFTEDSTSITSSLQSVLPNGIQVLAVASFVTVAFIMLVGGQLAYTPKSFEVVDLASLVPDDSKPTQSADGMEQSQELLGVPQAETDRADQSSEPVVALKPINSSVAAPPISIFPDLPAVPRNEQIILGNPDADRYLIECVSYTCQTCRDVHPILKSLQMDYGDQLAIVLLPVPLERSCNPTMKRDQPAHRNSCKLTRLAMAIWQLDRDAFSRFHDWLMTSEDFQRYPRAWQEACSLVPESALIDMINDPVVQARISLNNDYLSRFEKLPAIIVGSKVIKGPNAAAEDELREFVHQQLGDPAPGGQVSHP